MAIPNQQKKGTLLSQFLPRLAVAKLIYHDQGDSLYEKHFGFLTVYTSGSSKSSLLTLYYSHLHGQSSLLITITSDRLSKYLSTRSSSLLTTYSSSFRILIEKNVISTTLSLFLHSINHRTSNGLCNLN